MATIAHLTSVHRPTDTRIFRKECRTLVKAGHDVYLVAPATHDDIVDGVRILAVDPPVGRWERFTSTANAVMRRAKPLGADAYHIHDPELLPWCAVRLRDTPWVYDMHEDLVGQIHTKDWIPEPLRLVVSALANVVLRMLLKGRPVIFAEASYAETYDWLNQTVTVQNMPVVDELIDIDKPRLNTPTLGYIGGVRRDRGSIVTLKALHQVQQRGYDVGWHCIGPMTDNHKAELTSLQAELSVDNVHFTGYLPPEEGWPQIARCHIGVALLEKTPNFVGSYPTKLFEYMALGLPVITSDIPIYQRVVDDAGCGLVVDPKRSDAVADAIAYLLDHPEEARQMGERGRQIVQTRYNWKQESDRLLAFYNNTVLA